MQQQCHQQVFGQCWITMHLIQCHHHWDWGNENQLIYTYTPQCWGYESVFDKVILYWFHVVREQWLCSQMLDFQSVPFGTGSKTSYFRYGTILFKRHYAATPEQCLLCFVFGRSFPLPFLALLLWKCVPTFDMQHN
jgi:hypothetical protein